MWSGGNHDILVGKKTPRNTHHLCIIFTTLTLFKYDYIQFLLSCHLLAEWTILERWGWFLMPANSKVEQPVHFISRRFWMELSETVWPAVWLWVITMSPVLPTLKKLLSDRLGAASCHQNITPSTSGGLKVTVCSLFMIPKCQRLWDISSCKLKSVSHFLS